MASEKMSEAAADAWMKDVAMRAEAGMKAPVVVGPLHDAGVFLRGGINAAWTKFNIDDPAAIPETKFAPSDRLWLFLEMDGTPVSMTFSINELVNRGDTEYLAFADPVDVMPVPDSEGNF